MAKDPAINWYFDNWGGGTKTMSRHLKGCYIDLLDAQFHSGHLSLDEVKHVLGADFSAWQTLQKKFKQDVHGNYFNERLDCEINKRLENSKKQSERVKKRWESYHGTNNGITAVIPLDGTGTESNNILNSELVKETARKVFNDKIWAEATGMGHSITRDELAKWMSQFNASLVGDNISNFSESTYKKMFGGWLNKQRSKGYKLPEKTKSSTQPLQTLNG